MAVFERLTHRVERMPGELEEFVEKQDAAMREADFARSRSRATANQSRDRDRVVRCAEWPVGRYDDSTGQEASHRMHGDDLECLAFQQARENPRHTSRQQRLSAARRPGENQSMITGGGDLKRPACEFLPDDVGQIRPVSCISLDWRGGSGACQAARLKLMHRLAQRSRGADGHRRHQRRLGGVIDRHE